MLVEHGLFVHLVVALLAEGVDRNRVGAAKIQLMGTSPSSRRAWIEIGHFQPGCLVAGVALLAEGVDRNSVVLSMSTMHSQSPSSRRAWIEIPNLR